MNLNLIITNLRSNTCIRIVQGLKFYSTCEPIQVTLVDADVSHKTPGSETNDFIIHNKASSVTIFFLLAPLDFQFLWGHVV